MSRDRCDTIYSPKQDDLFAQLQYIATLSVPSIALCATGNNEITQ
jgi:hypothetical protein